MALMALTFQETLNSILIKSFQLCQSNVFLIALVNKIHQRQGGLQYPAERMPCTIDAKIEILMEKKDFIGLVPTSMKSRVIIKVIKWSCNSTGRPRHRNKMEPRKHPPSFSWQDSKEGELFSSFLSFSDTEINSACSDYDTRSKW